MANNYTRLPAEIDGGGQPARFFAERGVLLPPAPVEALVVVDTGIIVVDTDLIVGVPSRHEGEDAGRPLRSRRCGGRVERPAGTCIPAGPH